MDLKPELAAVLPAGVSVSGRARPAVRVPVAAAVICAVLATAGLIAWNAFDPDQLFTPLSWLMPATFTAMGSLIVWRQPRNTVGWIVLLSGPLAAVGLACDGWAVRSFAHRAGPLPLGAAAAYLANLILSSHLIFLVAGLIFLLFPDGRLPSPRWRWLPWYGAFIYGVLAVTAALIAGVAVVQFSRAWPVCAYLAVRFLTRYFETRTLTPFAIYCAVFGAASLAWLTLR